MIILIKILQTLLALSILILVHELGHFAFAKLFRIRVEKFYLFFDIGGALFKFKPKNSDTEYGIGWLPLGGYCKIAGMVDESFDTESLKKEPQPWEFRSRPAWQRFLVMSGGVLFNFIFAILIYAGILAGWGQSYVGNEGNSIYVNDLAYEMGFRTGDRVLKFDDYVPDNFGMLQIELARQTASKATVLRDGDTLDIYTIPPASVNSKAGLKRGDRITAIAGTPVRYVQESREMLKQYAGTKVPVSVVRDTDTMMMDLQVDTSGLFGIITQIPGIKTKEYNMISAIPAGVKLAFANIGGYTRDLKLVFTPSTEAYKSVGSFISIGQIFPDRWDWYSFMNILALLSIMLGVMNLLPIPALDGGHIVFTIYEMITRRKPSDGFLIGAQTVGIILLFGLMILAFGNDIGRLLK